MTSGHGRVVEFDEAVGLGYVTGAGGSRYRFHCTEIADGSRTIAVGTDVDFEVIAGHGGEWEAGGLRPASSAPAPQGPAGEAPASQGPPGGAPAGPA